MQIAFDLAVVQESLSDWPKAEAAYLEIVKVLDNAAALELGGDLNPAEIDGQAAETYERLGRVCIQAGQSGRARDYFQKAHDRVKTSDPRGRGGWRLTWPSWPWPAKTGRRPSRRSTSISTRCPRGSRRTRPSSRCCRSSGAAARSRASWRPTHFAIRRTRASSCSTPSSSGAAGYFDAAERIFKEMAKATATPDVYRGLFQLYAAAKPPHFDRLVILLDENLGAAAGKKENDSGDADAAARARAMLVVLRQDAALVKGIMPVVQERLTRNVAMNSSTCYFLGVLASRTNQLDAAEQIFRQCLANNQRPHG